MGGVGTDSSVYDIHFSRNVTLPCSTSAFGTNAKCRLHRIMSEFGSKAENICSL